MTKFNIFPAIDLLNGNCVRLLQGEFNQATIYKNNPLKQVSFFIESGFEWIHLVDLNAAMGENDNKKLILDILKSFGKDIKIQLGGGIRSADHIKFWIDNQVRRVIIGTLACENSDIINSIGKEFEKKIVLGIDVRKKLIAVHGWKKQLDLKPIDLIKRLDQSLIDAIIYTDISRDGALQGVNIDDTVELSKSVSIPIIASGGVSSVEEIKKLIHFNDDGIVGVILGKALYEKKISLNQIKDIFIK